MGVQGTVIHVQNAGGVLSSGGLSTTTTSRGNRRVRRRPGSFTNEEFLKLKDKDLQAYIITEKSVLKEACVERMVDNEDKLGFYLFDEYIRRNMQGTFYKQTKLQSWLVYNKKTKKVSMSSSRESVVRAFMKKFFAYPNIAGRFIRKLTPTLAKKIVEGKVKTVADLLKYEASYGLKRKNLKPDTLYNFVLHGGVFLSQNFDHPENVTIDELELLTSQGVMNCAAVRAKAFPIDGLTMGQITKKYGEWSQKQSEKLDSLTGSGNEEVGDYDDEESF